jgi:hypothetical protein
LAGENGPVTVESIIADSTSEAVYNLDVETDHRYLVTNVGVLAHNANSGCNGLQNVAESMSPRAAKYQLQVTGTPAGQAFFRNGVKFDGFKNGTLLDAKGPGYGELINGRLADRIAMNVLDQAERQISAAGATPIEWIVAEKDFAIGLKSFFSDNNINIAVSWVPMK